MIVLSKNATNGTYKYKNSTIWTNKSAKGWRWKIDKTQGIATTENDALKNAAKYIDEKESMKEV